MPKGIILALQPLCLLTCFALIIQPEFPQSQVVSPQTKANMVVYGRPLALMMGGGLLGQVL